MRTFAMVVSGFNWPTFTKRVTCSPLSRAVSVSFTHTPDWKFVDTDEPSASSRTRSHSWSEYGPTTSPMMYVMNTSGIADLQQRSQRAPVESPDTRKIVNRSRRHLREHVDRADERRDRDDLVEARGRLQRDPQHGDARTCNYRARPCSAR